MKKITLPLVTLVTALLLLSCTTQKASIIPQEVAKKEILTIMRAQEEAWSNHDLEGFMQGYWKSDSLKFFGRNGVTSGWDKTLQNYKKGYPTKGHTGTLKFTIKDISPITNDAYSVMGAYHLERTEGMANGVFMIIFKRINNTWKIIADTSC